MTSALYVTGNITIQGLNFGVTLAVDSSVEPRHFFVDGAGSLTLSNLTLSGGMGWTSGYAYGGSIWSFGNLTIHNCTFTGNTSNQEGGAIQCSGDSPSVSIDNSTISGNTSNGIGGAMDIGAATMTLRYVTMTNNTSPAGSGNAVSIYKNSATMINTLIVGNSKPYRRWSERRVPFSPASTNNILGNATAPGLTNGTSGNYLSVPG